MREDRRDPQERESLVLHEEEADVSAAEGPARTVRFSKAIEERHVREGVPRESEHGHVEHVDPRPDDDGRVWELPDGSVSIPILEEEIVVTKRTVVRERIVVRKETLVEQFEVEADIRAERLVVDADSPELAARISRSLEAQRDAQDRTRRE